MHSNTATFEPVISRAPAVSRVRSAPGALLALPFAAVVYNAVLAYLNAHGVAQTFASVAICDGAILASTLAILVVMRLISETAVRVVIISCVVSAFVSISSGVLSLDCARNFTIIAVFYSLGTSAKKADMIILFRMTSLAILVFLVIELISTEFYVGLFAPSSYYSNTRNIEEFSLDSTGLFRNALGFEGRFSFGLSDHRTASLFIEQVSLANFAAVLCLFTLCMFPFLKRWDRVISIGTIVLILVTNDTRTTLVFALVCLGGYFVFPRLPKQFPILAFPTVLAIGTLVYVLTGGDERGDDMVGRISITMHHLSEFGPAEALGFSADTLPDLMDSGYAHVIASCTLAGLLALWIGAALVVPLKNRPQMRCSFALNILFAINLMIGGTAMFSLKIAAPLWVLVGFMTSLENPYLPARRLLRPIASRV